MVFGSALSPARVSLIPAGAAELAAETGGRGAVQTQVFGQCFQVAERNRYEPIIPESAKQIEETHLVGRDSLRQRTATVGNWE